MIQSILIGDILESQMQTLVNTVNCVGIMGKGIAAAFKARFPDLYTDYKARCDRGEVQLGKPYIYKQLIPPWIINFPTKDHWRANSKLSSIEDGLKYLVDHLEEWQVESLALPPLGCGNGQLDWMDVGPLMYHYLAPVSIPVDLFAPHGTPKAQLTREFLSSASTDRNNEGKSTKAFNPAWLVLVEILSELEKHPYHNPVGRTIFQKIAYVATEQKVPTQLVFNQKSYGPFSVGIKRLISELANNNLVIEKMEGQMFRLYVGPHYPLFRQKWFAAIEQYRKVIERTADLFARMDTNQAEIATTIFFTSRILKKQTNGRRISEQEIFDYVLEWKKRRRPPISQQDVASSIRNLAMLRWLDVDYSDGLPVPSELEI